MKILGNLVASSRGKWKGDKDQWILFADIEGLVVEGNGEINGQGSSWWEHSSRPTVRIIILIPLRLSFSFFFVNNMHYAGLSDSISIKHTRDFFFSYFFFCFCVFMRF